VISQSGDFTQIYVLLDTTATNSVVGVTEGPFDVPRRIHVHVFTYILRMQRLTVDETVLFADSGNGQLPVIVPRCEHDSNYFKCKRATVIPQKEKNIVNTQDDNRTK
jgi:hypothetical protein